MNSILVIDDERVVLDMIKKALQMHGSCVETATDGADGIQKYNRQDFDLVITDVCMPGTDGLDVLSHIRKSPKKAPPTIGISGTPWLLENSGFDVVLAKPFSIQALFETVDRFIAGSVKRAVNA